jgi:hypothetical protein
MAATAIGPITGRGDEAGGCNGSGPTHASSTAFLGAPQGHESRLDCPTDSVDDAVHRGQQAWVRLKNDDAFSDWVDVGRAHIIGRQEAMRLAHVNEPTGHRYKESFGTWLKKFGFADLDKSDRSRLFVVMDNLPAIEAWRATLTTTERTKLNHPSTVLRKWQAATKIPSADKAKKPTVIEKLQESVAALEEENHKLKREVERAGNLWTVGDRAEDIAAVMQATLTPAKFDQVIAAMKKLAARRLDQAAPKAKKAGGRL